MSAKLPAVNSWYFQQNQAKQSDRHCRYSKRKRSKRGVYFIFGGE
jgi:hypothetical protein